MRIDPDDSMEIVSVVTNEEKKITSINLTLEPIGDVPCAGDREKLSRKFTWSVCRIHVRGGGGNGDDDNSSKLFKTSEEIGSGEENPSRFCAGLQIISSKYVRSDLLEYFKQDTFLSYRNELLAMYLEKVLKI